MLQQITSFFSGLRQKLFVWRVEREIYDQIFPHLNNMRDHGYAFHSDRELWKAAHHGTLDAQFDIETVEKEADRMGKAYGDAFRYIMYRDLNRVLARYKKLMERRVHPEACEPQLVATHA